MGKLLAKFVRGVFIFLALAISCYGSCSAYDVYRFRANAKEVLALAGVVDYDLIQCEYLSSRAAMAGSGTCKFKVLPAEVPSVIEKMHLQEVDMNKGRAYALGEDLCWADCKEYFKTAGIAETVATPEKDFGGVSLPHLRSTSFNRDSGLFCACFSYGWG